MKTYRTMATRDWTPGVEHPGYGEYQDDELVAVVAIDGTRRPVNNGVIVNTPIKVAPSKPIVVSEAQVPRKLVHEPGPAPEMPPPPPNEILNPIAPEVKSTIAIGGIAAAAGEYDTVEPAARRTRYVLICETVEYGEHRAEIASPEDAPATRKHIEATMAAKPESISGLHFRNWRVIKETYVSREVEVAWESGSSSSDSRSS